MRLVRRSLKSLALFLIVVVFAMFSMSNRTAVEVSFAPTPYSIEIPLFLLVLGCIAFGLLAAWVMLMSSVMKARRVSSREHKKAMALENELKGVKLEQETQGIPAVIANR